MFILRDRGHRGSPFIFSGSIGPHCDVKMGGREKGLRRLRRGTPQPSIKDLLRNGIPFAIQQPTKHVRLSIPKWNIYRHPSQRCHTSNYPYLYQKIKTYTTLSYTPILLYTKHVHNETSTPRTTRSSTTPLTTTNNTV